MKSSLQHFLLLILISSLLAACGSRSSDFSTGVEIENPLPPCPDSPNCVRITEYYSAPIDSTWEATLSALKAMKPYDITLTPDEYRIDSVFMVVFFRDDFTIRLEPADSTSTYLHLRSSSRVGHSDLGVNRQRVKDFLGRIEWLKD